MHVEAIAMCMVAVAMEFRKMWQLLRVPECLSQLVKFQRYDVKDRV